MKCLCNLHCRLIKDVDMFGKEPEFYYKGKPKKKSWIGRIFSFSFILIYLAFFLYKLIKMLKKTDVTFYDTFTYPPKPSAVKITRENFYGGFALEDPFTYDAFIDEGVYIPKAYFKRAENQGESFDWQVKELELERCKLEKFGPLYQEKLKNKNLNNLYCFKEMDFILEGHFSYDLYSFFYIQFFPCINSTTKHDCKPLEVIDYYLKNTFVSFQLQDIELTPHNYKTPFMPRVVDVYSTVGKKLFNEIHAYFQVVKIETDMDWIGFDEFENIKTEVFLKYDEMVSMNNIIEKNIYETGESFCDFTIKLSENVRTERRTYIKLISILGDVGGLMEVLFTLFRIISSFSVDILYEISLVNNLFSFDLNKKTVLLKEKKDFKKIYFPNDEAQKIDSKKNIIKISPQGSINKNEEMTIGTENRLNEDNKNKIKNERNFVHRLSRKKSSLKGKLNFTTINSDEYKNKNYLSSRKKSSSKLTQIEINTSTMNNQEENDEHKENVISKIKMTRACVYLYFCFTRRRKIVQNFLLDEGMGIICEKLDIFNIFEKMYKDEEIMEKIVSNNQIEMSGKCKLKLRSIYNKITKFEKY